MKFNKKKQFKLIITFLLVSIGMLAVFFFQNHPLQPTGQKAHRSIDPAVNSQEQSKNTIATPDTESVNEQITGLEVQQSELMDQIQALQQQIDDMAISAQAPLDYQMAPHPEETYAYELDSDAEAKSMERIYNQIDLFERTLARETPDPNWTYDAIQKLNQAMSSESRAQSIELLEVVCRSSMCRMDIGMKSSNIEDEFLHLSEMIPWNGEMFLQLDDLESGEATVYIAREEHTLPKL